jgi:hypothetical protein
LIVFAFEPALDDLQMQQAEKTTPVTLAEGYG